MSVTVASPTVPLPREGEAISAPTALPHSVSEGGQGGGPE